MKPKVYLETSIVSYLTADPSRDLVTAANQQLTNDWWNNRRSDYELFISSFVLDEAKEGDPQMSKKRLSILARIPLLELNDEAKKFAKVILAKKVLPPKAAIDVSHIALATVHQIDFLLTWNCKHIANAQIFRRVARICRENGYEPPTVCTPQEILGVEDADLER